ncbi:hypothetical protein LY76DRAFT_68620 [Colletotrichum caudatum]|nr:hypothetical protein LY76DRAFT_68620 [Colletotrichum caudatum]
MARRSGQSSLSLFSLSAMPLIALTAQTSFTGARFPSSTHKLFDVPCSTARLLDSFETSLGHHSRWSKSQCDTWHTSRRSFAELGSA